MLYCGMVDFERRHGDLGQLDVSVIGPPFQPSRDMISGSRSKKVKILLVKVRITSKPDGKAEPNHVAGNETDGHEDHSSSYARLTLSQFEATHH